MDPAADVVIVGGGVIGLSIAYFLAQENASVTVLDQGDLGQEASWAGAGILTAGNPRRARSPMGWLQSRGSALFAKVSPELLDLTGVDNGYLRCGGLRLRCSEEYLERRQLENTLSEERGEGVYS